MAKSDSLLNLQGTLAGVTFVKSRAYGDHVRAKRGTYKKAELNHAMQEGSANLISANIPAKIFKDAIDPYRADMIDGTLWHRLVSLFRKQLSQDGAIDFGQMAGFEINSRHTFESFIHLHPALRFDKKKSLLRVDLQYTHHPTFKKKKYVDGYRFTIIGMFPDLKKKTSKTEAISSAIIPLNGPVTSYSVELTVPARTTKFILCVKLEGCEKGAVVNSVIIKGLRALAGGDLTKSLK